MKRWIVFCLILLAGSPVLAMSIVFINPGKHEETYWLTATRAMESAAKQLNVKLEVLYAERQPPQMVELARKVTERPLAQRPDYVIFPNEAGAGPEMLRLFNAAGIKTFLAFSGAVEANDRAMLGRPRERLKTWLGSLEPHAEEAGYQTARALIEKGRAAGLKGADGKLHFLAISGDRATPTSIRRSEGMKKAVSEHSDVVLDQEVFGGWNRDKAEEQANWLYQRYPDARLVWSGNDLMAFGAMQASDKRGGAAARVRLFSGINTSREAMDAVLSGRLAALSGGHFIAGAWALVLLYDYDRGRDFAKDEGLELDQSMFALFSPAEAKIFVERYGDLRFDQVDFRRFSKVHNSKLKRYDFNFRQLLH